MTDFYIQKDNDLSDYNCDQNIIIKKNLLKHIARVKYEEDIPSIIPEIHDWYPYTNSYYPYTEDVDAFARVNHLLATRPACESFTNIPCCECTRDQDVYSEKSAQIQYLYSNPVSFLILGKPGIGEQELGKLFADHWKCVYIDPETLIHEEIDSGSRAGHCIEFNLRCGRAIGVDVVLGLVEKRVKSKSAQHRGFVICGFPMIPNDLYEEDPVTSESTVFNVHEIFEEVVDNVIEIGVPPVIADVAKVSQAGEGFDAGEEEEEGEGEASEVPPSQKTDKLPPQMPLDTGSATGNICAAGEMEKDFEAQIDFIFSLFEKPFVILYIVCNNSDVVSKHSDFRFDIYTRQIVDLQREHEDKMVYTYFTRVPGTEADEVPEDFIDVVKHNTMNFNPSSIRQLVKLPRDFPANVVNVLDRYRYYAMPVIERHVLAHNIEYFIKLDGRIAPIRMLNAIRMRLQVLPLQKVVLPGKLLVSSEPDGEGSPAEDLDVEGLTFTECFELLRKKQISSPMFKWGLSDWGIKCPVSMKEGGYQDGDAKFAVHFMNKIFFLSDEDAYIKFYRNPRPYLLPPYPKPSCKIFVMGPRCSGKTAVSCCLGYLLKGEVLDFDKLIQSFIKAKHGEYRDQIRLAALNKGVEIVNEQRRLEWEQKEQERQETAEKWVKRQVELLEETVSLKKSLSQEEEQDKVEMNLEMSPFPTLVTYGTRTHSVDLLVAGDEDADKVKTTIEELENLIRVNGLPEFTDIPAYEQLIANPEQLLDYLPPHLLPPERYDVEPATVFDDFVKEYAENAVLNASYEGIVLDSDYVAEQLIEIINEVEKRSHEQGNNTGDWILDGIPPNNELVGLLITECLPDDIFVLRDVDDYRFLLERYENRGLNKYRDFRQFFMDLGKTDAAWRSPSLYSTDSYRKSIAKDVLADVLDETYITSEQEVQGSHEENVYSRKRGKKAAVEAYEKELRKFDEDWESLMDTTLSDQKITIVEISVTDKSLDTLLKEVVKNTEDRYRQLASEFTSEDRVQEVEDFGEPDLQDEELGEAEEKPADTEDLFFQNRRFGDTFNYCPVTFHDHWVLWKGKEEFTAKFRNKLYLMCNETAMNNFIEDPRRYLLESKPPNNFPPPRICIVGPNGSGKTTVAKALSRNLGLYCAIYDEIIKRSIAPKSKFNLYKVLETVIAGSIGGAVQNYLTNDEPLLEEFLNPLIQPFWFDDPIKTFGFVFDGFPKRPSDVDYMAQHAAIPDIIVELSISQGDIHTRLFQKRVDEWQREITEKQEMYKEEKSAWEEKRNNRFKELMELKREERYAAKRREKGEQVSTTPELQDVDEVEDDTDHSVFAAKSQVSFDSVVEEADIEEVNIILAEELPEPIFEEEPEESLEEAMERIAVEVDDSYISELDFLRAIREQCETELIPWVTVDAGMTEEKVFAQVMRVVDKYKFRNNSLFERVYVISVDLAEKLLSNGYYFLSKFGKTCPVQIFENFNPVQMFLPLEQTFDLYPVIHRQYIYFLAKKENLNKFREDPLKYTTQKNVNFSLIPLKLAIIGPPKCGKTTLAERFKHNLGMKVISRGQAVRYVLRYLQFSELAKNMESVLRLGWELTNEMVIKSVEALSFDGRSITQGFILDGFPNSIQEVRHLAELGLVPNLVIDLQAEDVDIYEFLASSVGKRNLPAFSSKFIGHRCEEWIKTKEAFRIWLDKEYQIIGKIEVKPCKWGVWNASYELAMAVFSEVKHYYQFANCDAALRLGNMLITPLEFIERQGCYKQYCPSCLYHLNCLINGGDPPDRTGVVQFRYYYYYLCADHIEEFISDPEKFLPPYNPRTLPAELPIRIFPSKIPKNCYEEGLCIICFWENQPRDVKRKGSVKFAVLYREKVYLFERIECLELFMREPHKYFAKVINFKGRPYPSLDYKELPTLGLLQQYDVKQIIQAIRSTGILRPVIPGLSIETSASLNMGLVLKLNNPKTPEKFIPLYIEARDKYNERRTNLINYLAQMKKMINPYLYYDEPLPKFVDPLGYILNPENKLKDSGSEQVQPEEISEYSGTETTASSASVE